jgi:hypothetical protein
VTASAAACQAVWLRQLLKELGQEQRKGTIIYRDNQSTVFLTKNHGHHSRTKHIDIRFHFIRNLVENGTVEIRSCYTEKQLADMFTKALKKEQFYWNRSRLGIGRLAEFESRGDVEK